MFSLIKNATRTLLGIRIPPQELAENVVRAQLRLHGINLATIPSIAIHNIAEDALANSQDPAHAILRIKAVVAQIAGEIGNPTSRGG